MDTKQRFEDAERLAAVTGQPVVVNHYHAPWWDHGNYPSFGYYPDGTWAEIHSGDYAGMQGGSR